MHDLLEFLNKVTEFETALFPQLLKFGNDLLFRELLQGPLAQLRGKAHFLQLGRRSLLRGGSTVRLHLTAGMVDKHPLHYLDGYGEEVLATRPGDVASVRTGEL